MSTVNFKIANSFTKSILSQKKGLVHSSSYLITSIEITYPANVWFEKKEQSFILYANSELGFSLNLDDWFTLQTALDNYVIYKVDYSLEDPVVKTKPTSEWSHNIISGLLEFMESQ